MRVECVERLDMRVVCFRKKNHVCGEFVCARFGHTLPNPPCCSVGCHSQTRTAGKTTLMDCICGRKTVGRITGQLLANGRPVEKSSWSRVVSRMGCLGGAVGPPVGWAYIYQIAWIPHGTVTCWHLCAAVRDCV